MPTTSRRRSPTATSRRRRTSTEATPHPAPPATEPPPSDDEAPVSPAIKASDLILDPNATAGEVFRACLRSCLDDHLAPNEALVVKNRHPDNLHQTRVSWRRARAAMSLFGELLAKDEHGREIKLRMREIVLPLGPARDADVLLARAEKEGWPAKHVRPLRGRRRSTYSVALALLRSPQWREMKNDLRAWLDDPAWLDGAAGLRDAPARVVTDRALEKRYRRIRTAGPHLATMPAHDLHRIRIEGKKLRYGCEFFASLYADAPGAEPADFSSRLGKMQDAFGEANDVAVAVHVLSAHAIPTERIGVVGERTDALERWTDVMELTPFWRLRRRPAKDADRDPDQILHGREVPLGGIRALTVSRTLPHRDRSLVGAWCFLDHYGPATLDEGTGMDVPPHPHTGLQTVSWLFAGEIEHRDSGGTHAIVRPGELNLMTAGHGIAHSEVSTPDTAELHGVQLWIALPQKAINAHRRFDHYVPQRSLLPGGGSARVFLGKLPGVAHSPVESATALLGAQLDLPAGSDTVLRLAAGHEHAVLVDTGEVALGERTLGRGDLAVLDAGRERLHLQPVAGRARLLLLGGEPFTEDLVMWWNFVGRTHEDIVRFREEWQAEGSRFGHVEGYAGAVARLPAPELPKVRLRPRRRTRA